MASRYTASWVDNSGEPSSTTLYLKQITSANFDNTVGNTTPGQSLYDLRVALAALSRCNFTSHNIQAVQILEQGTLPADRDAQREIKVRFDYVDTAGFKGSFTVPAPNLDVFGQTGSDQIDLDEVAVAAFVTAIEAHCSSRFDNDITILRGVVVGRNI